MERKTTPLKGVFGRFRTHLTILLTSVFFLTAFTSFGSHFRFSTISWEPTANANEVKFTLRMAYRSSYGFWPQPVNVGNNITVDANFEYGDGTPSFPIILTVTQVDGPGDWFYGEATYTHTYPGAGPYTAGFGSCCRIGALQNNANDDYSNFVSVNPGGTNSSPVSSINPLLTVPVGSPSAPISIPYFDPDGDPVTFSVPTSAEVGDGFSIISNPAGVTVNANGTVTFDTQGLTIGHLYNIVVKISDNNGASTIVDFIVVIGQNVGTPPVFDYPPTPANNTVFDVPVGTSFSKTIQASDADAGDSVVISQTGAPLGASFNQTLPTAAGNPVNTVMSFTPGAGDAGNSYVVIFKATDGNGLEATTSFTIAVRQPRNPQCAADFVLDYNPVGNIDATRTDSSQALGIPEDDDTFNFVTLGFGGSLTLGFNPPALNGPGNDLRVYETSFGSQTCQKYPETARIWATIDFVTWVDLGTVCLDGEVDLGILPYANAIRIVDETPVPSPSRDGYDVDGVLCLNGRQTTQQCVAQCEPDSVLYVSQGTRKDGNAVDANRSIPGRATGTPEDDDTYNFFTLGTGGTITLFYSQGCLYDQQGYDFRVVETSFGDPACRRYPESAHIEVSMDDVTYYSIDSICLDGMVDFSGTGLAYIKYIRITDVSKLFGGDAMDYYDVDGVECINNAGALRTAPKDPSNGIYIEDEYMQMYPNPVNNGQSVTIRVESIDANPIKVDIYNTMGALVYSVEGDALVHEQIDISNYTPGIYIVKMDVDGVVRTKKLIVQ